MWLINVKLVLLLFMLIRLIWILVSLSREKIYKTSYSDVQVTNNNIM